ncbi:MAG TPA: AMP-binding protein [Bryobacteraceae bacterium]
MCLLNEQHSRNVNAPALLSDGRPALSYDKFRTLVDTTNRTLNGAGYHRGDRIALVISNGPEAATAFLSIAAGHICAPLNSAYRASEFEFYLSDLKPKAIVIEAGLETAATQVAESLNIPVYFLYPERQGAAGTFRLETGGEPCGEADFAGPDEVALVLHTSGTTSRPKIVPLTHANLLDNARNIARSLQLTSQDRCLNVMPLFHVHGLIGAVLSSLSAGASVFCSPGFQAGQFFAWFEGCRPSWYTAVPTMHQAILARATQNQEAIGRSQLRFIRSCSSALPPQVMAELEEVFRVPVVEAYGMTEASHQMACNPLPPAMRKPGSVGIATGPEVAIMSAEGDLVPAMMTGEIVIRGVNVTAGYDNNPEANASAYQQGWFRTGDQGYLDADGYLFINGRTKEMINRGGEKICPREIDEALMDHPAVRQAVAFALKDPRLGEEVGAAVVLRDGATASESELQLFVSGKLADFKVPRKIVFVAEIPKGPTGKLQRIGLAQKLLPDATAAMPEAKREFVAPRNETEVLLASIWRSVLSVDLVGIHDNFFDLGGDSSAAAQMLTRVDKEMGQALAPTALFESPTVEQLARKLRSSSSRRARVSAMQTGGPGKPFFCVHGHPLFFAWARHVAPERSFLSLLPPDVEDVPGGYTLENLAKHHIETMRDVQPTGPYYLGGWCVEGVVAFEVARQLRLAGEEVGGVFLIDARNPRTRDLDAAQGGRPSLRTRFHYHQSRLRQLDPREWPQYFAQRWVTLAARIKRRVWRSLYALHLLQDRRESSFSRDIDEIVALAVHGYQPGTFDGRVILIRPEDRAKPRHEDPGCGWGPLAPKLQVREVPGTHRTLFDEPNVAVLAGILCEMMDGESRAAELPASTSQPARAAHAAASR